MRKLTHHELLSRQKLKDKSGRVALSVVLNNIRSLYNVGSIFRTSDGVGVEKIWICGITGHPPNNQISKTALGAQESVLWEYREDVKEVLRRLKSEGYEIVFLEQTGESVSYCEFKPGKEKVCLVLGNEISGVSSDMLSLSDRAIEIEMDGMKNSLNVSVAFGIVAYDIRKKLKRRVLINN